MMLRITIGVVTIVAAKTILETPSMTRQLVQAAKPTSKLEVTGSPTTLVGGPSSSRWRPNHRTSKIIILKWEGSKQQDRERVRPPSLK